MPIKQGTDELVLIRKAGDRKDANKVMWVTELERETEKDRDTEATVDGPVNSGGTLESTVTINCYMNQDDTLCDEIEDATEEDTLMSYGLSTRELRTKMESIKQNIVKAIGIVLTVLTTLKISQNLKLNLAYIIEKFVVGQHYQNRSRKTKLLMASTILLLQIQLTMVLCQKFPNLTNQAQLKLYNTRARCPLFF